MTPKFPTASAPPTDINTNVVASDAFPRREDVATRSYAPSSLTPPGLLPPMHPRPPTRPSAVDVAWPAAVDASQHGLAMVED